VIVIDADMVTVTHPDGRTTEHGIGTPEAFAAISRAWLRSGWDAKYVYSFTWLGRPIIQLPEDMFRLQELIWSVRPDVVIETGVAHGGSLVFHAGLCRLLGRGRVIGIDIEIRPHNREAIEAHPLAELITLIEGSSIDSGTVERVRRHVGAQDRVMVLLDSCHEKAHVLRELEAYAPLVSVGSYIIVMDGIMQEVVGAPRTRPDWTWNNPQQAAADFVAANSAYEIVEPRFAFNEGAVTERVTYWPGGIIRRTR
jgi:cephalosporin hydroxylase